MSNQPQAIFSSPKLDSVESPISVDELARMFNTAIVSTYTDAAQNRSQELQELLGSSSFRSILGAVRQLARSERLSEREASEQIITTFRKIDKIWQDYIVREGLERIRTQGS